MNMDPELLFDMVHATVPKALHPNILIVGSLAAAFFHRERLSGQAVATKDADVVVQPAGALDECVAIAKELLAADWTRIEDCYPCDKPEPVKALRVFRLQPKGIEAFFVELLGLPSSDQVENAVWTACKLDDGWYCVPSFRYMALLGSDRRPTKFGIEHASPPLMALSNLLSHPEVGTDRMSGLIHGRKILRSAKDLGRVLALARLEPGELGTWVPIWTSALQTHFPTEAAALAARAGKGIAELLRTPAALEEAHFTTSVGLLRGHDVTPDQLVIQGKRLQVDVIEPVIEALGLIGSRAAR